MATVEKIQRRDGVVYKAKVRRQGHPTVCRTFHTRKAAERWALKFEASLDSIFEFFVLDNAMILVACA